MNKNQKKQVIENLKSIKFDFEEGDRVNILKEMEYMIFDRNGEKQKSYGPFSQSIEKTADLAHSLGVKVNAVDVFKILIALKLSRLSYSLKRDTIKDAIGYLAGLDDFLLENDLYDSE